MRIPEHYAADVLFFFDGHPEELALYEALFRAVEEAFPEGSVRVQKTQISFYGRHLFAAPCRCGGGRTGRRSVWW